MSGSAPDVELPAYLFEQAEQILLSDRELYELAVSVSVDAAGGRLGRRAEPDVSNLSGSWRFWNKFLAEMHKFLCTTDSEYNDLRKHLKTADATMQKAVIPIIAGTIGATFGIAAATLVPFVALILLALGKIGKNAWCALHHDEVHRETLGSDGQPIKLTLEPTKVEAAQDKDTSFVTGAQPKPA